MVEVLLMLFHVTPPSVDDSHLKTLPVCPLSVNVPLLEPAQAVVEPATEPPAEIGVTVIVTPEEFAEVHPPLCTTARYRVVVIKFE